MKFTKIPTDTFQKLQLNAGVLASSFTINPSTGHGTLNSQNIIGVTSGGITITAIPTFKDFGEDLDNVKKNSKELKRIVTWDIKASGTFATVDQDHAGKLFGKCVSRVVSAQLTTDTSIVPGKTYYGRAGSGTEQNPYVYIEIAPEPETLPGLYDNPVFRLVPVHSFPSLISGVDTADEGYTNLWFVGDYSDHNTGNSAGFMACRLMDTFSTGGFSMTTQDMEKGKFAFEFSGHYTMNSPDAVPFEMYVHTGS